MDDPAIDPALHRQALDDLSRLNTASRMEGILWKALVPELDRVPRLSVVDVATGRGDMIAGLVRRGGGRIEGHGMDISLTACDEARRRHSSDNLRFHVADVFESMAMHQAVGYPDVIISTLFIHHLSDDKAIQLLEWMHRTARRRVVVVDLERRWINWWIVRLGVNLLTRSPVVRLDSDLSIRAAYTRAELRELLHRAGIDRFRHQRHLTGLQLVSFLPAAVVGEHARDLV
jgi:ubiquinone/menaquinone biosynthesis C-methylase UbiE